jgi:hypothetical protein
LAAQLPARIYHALSALDSEIGNTQRMSLFFIFNGLIPENPILPKLDFVPRLRRMGKWVMATWP